jgi:hypothetical protein
MGRGCEQHIEMQWEASHTFQPQLAAFGAAGAVRVNKREMDLKRLQAITGFVPQEDVVHEDLTVRENLVSETPTPSAQ